MASFERASPALKEILLRIYNAEKPIEVDHHLYEFGSVEYHIKSSVSEPQVTYLSISTPFLSQGVFLSYGLSPFTLKMVRQISTDVLHIVEPANDGYQLTLRLDFSKLPHNKESLNIITEVSSVQAVILSSQLKEMLQNVNSGDSSQGTYKPIKLIYHPKEPFYVIRQELIDVVSLKKWAKVPPCNWSPIPPLELRGEPFEDLSTNGGFVSFDISSHHVEGKRLDKIVWSLLNFYAYVKHHVKCTRGFIQRRMRRRLDNLVEVLEKSRVEDGQIKKVQGWKKMRKMVASKSKMIKRRWGDLGKKIKRIRFRIKIHGFARFRRRWLKMPSFSSSTGYTKLQTNGNNN
ncbi:actin-related protein 2/3 complex subunit 2B isoform X2 [Gossypium arboreum]|uniref:actin-related protein 2/3 complex subunit 2B isoform X2 n=1 Tax=Gossypium arboreum TaxID=29729 RepID=UPI0008192048|nr:actin-related protein 2/3 complex subunit 2B isoform X2 [Gossypium arboreum]